jgi:hypothetical protein
VVFGRTSKLSGLTSKLSGLTQLKKFREPRMRGAIFAYFDNGGEGLGPAQAIKADLTWTSMPV